MCPHTTICPHTTGRTYYYNAKTLESSWTTPMFDQYKNLLRQHRQMAKQVAAASEAAKLVQQAGAGQEEVGGGGGTKLRAGGGGANTLDPLAQFIFVDLPGKVCIMAPALQARVARVPHVPQVLSLLLALLV